MTPYVIHPCILKLCTSTELAAVDALVKNGELIILADIKVTPPQAYSQEYRLLISNTPKLAEAAPANDKPNFRHLDKQHAKRFRRR